MPVPTNFVKNTARKIYTHHVDLMDCSSSESISLRLLEAYVVILKMYFKKESFFEMVKNFLKNLPVGVSSDLLTGELAFELRSKKGCMPSLNEILNSLEAMCAQKNAPYL